MEPLIWIGVIGVSAVALRKAWTATAGDHDRVSRVAALEQPVSTDPSSTEPGGSVEANDSAWNGTWIELDVEPLFRSSKKPPTSVTDLIEDRRTERP